MTEDGAMEVWRLAHNATRPITLRKAARELGYADSQGVASRIKAAWKWLHHFKYDVEATEIAYTFVDRYGNYLKKKGNWS